MKRARHVVAACAIAVAVAVPSTPAGAEGTIGRVGWWTRNPAAGAPEGGMNVSHGPDGAVSVGAVQIISTTALTDAFIIFPEESGIQADSAQLQVCLTPNDWKAGDAQPYAEAPKPECEGASIAMKRTASASTWAAEVTSLLGDLEEEGKLSLMIVPAGPATVPVAFEVRLGKPTFNANPVPRAASPSSSGSGTFTSGSGGTTSSGSSDSFDSSTPSSGTGSSVDAAPTGAATFSSPVVVSGPVSASAPAAPTTADGAAGAPPVTDGSDGTGELAALPSQAATGVVTPSGNHAVQAMFFVFLATLAGAGAGFGRWFLRRRSDSAFA